AVRQSLADAGLLGEDVAVATHEHAGGRDLVPRVEGLAPTAALDRRPERRGRWSARAERLELGLPLGGVVQCGLERRDVPARVDRARLDLWVLARARVADRLDPGSLGDDRVGRRRRVDRRFSVHALPLCCYRDRCGAVRPQWEDTDLLESAALDYR